VELLDNTKEETSWGVMKEREYKNSVWYRLACNCQDPEDDAHIEIEIDKDVQMMTLTFGRRFRIFYNSSYTDEVFEKIKNWVRSMKWRLSLVIKMLFTGYIKIDSELIILDVKHIDSYIKALQEGRDYCFKRAEENKSKDKEIVNVKSLDPGDFTKKVN
jgi:hypothetical protein